MLQQKLLESEKVAPPNPLLRQQRRNAVSPGAQVCQRDVPCYTTGRSAACSPARQVTQLLLQYGTTPMKTERGNVRRWAIFEKVTAAESAVMRGRSRRSTNFPGTSSHFPSSSPHFSGTSTQCPGAATAAAQLSDSCICRSGDGTLRKAPDKWDSWFPREAASLHRMQVQVRGWKAFAVSVRVCTVLVATSECATRTRAARATRTSRGPSAHHPARQVVCNWQASGKIPEIQLKDVYTHALALRTVMYGSFDC